MTTATCAEDRGAVAVYEGRRNRFKHVLLAAQTPTAQFRKLGAPQRGRRLESGGCESALQAVEVSGAKDETVACRDIDEIEVDAGLCDLSSQVGEHTRSIIDLDDNHLALAAYAELRECERVLGRFSVRNEDVQLDLVRCPDACRSREVHPGVTHRSSDTGQSPGLVLDLDDQIERNRRAPWPVSCRALSQIDLRRDVVLSIDPGDR